MMERLKSFDRNYIEKRVAGLLNQSKIVAKKVINDLLKEGYLELNKAKHGSKAFYELIETEKGRRLGVATANPAISRQKAEQLLNELIERAKQINVSDELLYYVEKIKVFGSYLSDKNTLGDLDVAVKLIRKYDGDRFMKENQKRVHQAIQEGRRFANYVDQVYWPQREVMLLLKTKKKGLSLHDEDNDEVVKNTATKVVYEFTPKESYSKSE
jgi:hypothetical protein